MIPRSRIVVVFVLLGLVGSFMLLHKDRPVPVVKPLAEIPESFAGWHMIGQSSFSQNILEVLRPTDYLNRRYADGDGNKVDLYIGYHGGGEGSGGIHSPKHCMPGSGWYEFSTREQRINADGRTLNLVRSVYGLGDTRQLLLYWFDVQGRILNDEYSLKLWETLGSLTKGRRDASFIRIAVPFERDEDKAYALGLKFVRDMLPILDTFLPR